jgi:hypothetical protein
VSYDQRLPASLRCHASAAKCVKRLPSSLQRHATTAYRDTSATYDLRLLAARQRHTSCACQLHVRHMRQALTGCSSAACVKRLPAAHQRQASSIFWLHGSDTRPAPAVFTSVTCEKRLPAVRHKAHRAIYYIHQIRPSLITYSVRSENHFCNCNARASLTFLSFPDANFEQY